MKTVVIVDDEFGLIDNLTELLRDEGYRVVSAANGKDGLARVIDEKPDLVLTDLMMPIFDGRELVRELRAHPDFRELPIVMMSGSTKSAALADPAGGTVLVSAFLRKPFEWRELLSAVVRLIGPGQKP